MASKFLSSFHLATHAPSRLLITVLVGAAVALLLPAHISPILRGVVGWDCAAGLYIAIILLVLAGHNTADFLKSVAAREDPSRWMIQVLLSLAAFTSLIAIFTLLSGTKGLPPLSAKLHLLTGAATILFSWSLVHILFAVHYAHAYYGDTDKADDVYAARKGLEFPGAADPVFTDFLYYSFVVGMTCQVSDVNVTRPVMRVLTLTHGVLSFFFNTIILAFCVNIGASLIS